MSLIVKFFLKNSDISQNIIFAAQNKYSVSVHAVHFIGSFSDHFKLIRIMKYFSLLPFNMLLFFLSFNLSFAQERQVVIQNGKETSNAS